MVVTRQRGVTQLTIRGPETKASIAAIPQDAEFLGIQFRLGVFSPRFPLHELVDSAINLPAASSASFWLDSSAWQFPGFENADAFVDRMVRQGLLVREVGGQGSERTEQRRIVRATGLTRRSLRQMERAQRASALIERGVALRDVVWRAGYADQAHLTRSLKRFVGMTPRQLSDSFKTGSVHSA
jgi:hypothetical protein